MKTQKTAYAYSGGARLYFPGDYPKGQLPYVEFGGGSPSSKQDRWIIPKPICNALWALLFGPNEPGQSTYRRR